MTSRARRLRVSISEGWYDVLVGLANRRGWSVNIELHTLLLDALQRQSRAWREFDEAAARRLDTRGDLHRDIEQAAGVIPDWDWAGVHRPDLTIVDSAAAGLKEAAPDAQDGTWPEGYEPPTT